jgi:hypothetical protein
VTEPKGDNDTKTCKSNRSKSSKSQEENDYVYMGSEGPQNNSSEGDEIIVMNMID